MSTVWALEDAPAPDNTARLILVSISLNPAGEQWHAIHIDQLLRDIDLTRNQLDEYMRWFASHGIIVIDESWQIGANYPTICYLNTGITKGDVK